MRSVPLTLTILSLTLACGDAGKTSDGASSSSSGGSASATGSATGSSTGTTTSEPTVTGGMSTSTGQASTGGPGSTGTGEPGTTGTTGAPGSTGTGESSSTGAGESSSAGESGSSGGARCGGEQASCAMGELCCDGLECCAGVPVPAGAEFCSMMCPKSDRNAKTEFAEVDAAEVLRKVVALPITSWRYRKDGPQVRHIGPMAQDFHAAFGLWNSDTMIFPLDGSGVAMAAIQGLHARLVAAEAQNEELRARLARLEARLERSPGE